MLEKIGLPPKPAAKGSSWVLDASHCQSCCSQFTLFNRKHHCRRCGGLFCGNCVQSRMYLRGQGDAPVRVCEPCKELEEAARFEARHGHRNKQKKPPMSEPDPVARSALNAEPSTPIKPSAASSEPSSVSPEFLRQQAQEGKARFLTLRREGKTDEASKVFKQAKALERQADALAASIRKSKKISAEQPPSSSSEAVVVAAEKLPRGQGRVESSGTDDDLMKTLQELGWTDEADESKTDDVVVEMEGKTSRKSRAAEATQAEILGHKKKALKLKREGKLAEAKEELKKAKLLERQAEELAMLGEEDEDSEADAEEEDDDGLGAIMRSLEKEAMKDTSKEVFLNSEDLPGLGEDDDVPQLSDSDMMDPEMMAALHSMGWVEEPSQPDEEELRSQIAAHKRNAVALKRAGKVGEAKEELKQAKTLEKMLDSASEDAGVEVTEQDMQDPEILATLQMLGPDGESNDKPQNKLSLQQEILGLKRSALALRRQGKAKDAEMQLEQAKKLEEKLHSMQEISEKETKASSSRADTENAGMPSSSMQRVAATERQLTVPKKSKRELQSEILGVKRRALMLRREGKMDEAERELQEVKELEIQLKAMETLAQVEQDGSKDEDTGVLVAALKEIQNSTPIMAPTTHVDLLTGDDWTPIPQEASTGFPAPSQVEGVVSYAQEQKATLVSTTIDDSAATIEVASTRTRKEDSSTVEVPSSVTREEVLARKKRAVELKRKGDLAAAREELREAKLLERQLDAEDSSSGIELKPQQEAQSRNELKPQQEAQSRNELKQQLDAQSRSRRAELKPQLDDQRRVVRGELKQQEVRVEEAASLQAPAKRPVKDRLKLQKECLGCKRKALALRREGKAEEAEAELARAKQLEQEMEEMGGTSQQQQQEDGVESILLDPELRAALAGVGLHPRQPLPTSAEPGKVVAPKPSATVEERVRELKLQALKLKREGRKQDALKALQDAKQLERGAS